MLVNKIYKINSCDDVELGIKRDSKLEFRLSYDDEREIKAMVCIIPGIGGDAASGYKQHLAQYVASEFDVATLSVDYHCIGNRPQTGALFSMDDFDQQILKQRCDEIGILIDFDKDDLKDQSYIIQALTAIDKIVADKKQTKELNHDYLMGVSLTLEPKKGEYQNFGIMQAQDVINAILHIKQKPPFKTMGGGSISSLKTILVGSSHGGYISHLCAKIAPWLIDGIIDNSSYAKLPWRLMGIGKYADYTKYPCLSTKLGFSHVVICGFDKTHWSLYKSSPNYFLDAHEEIRFILNHEHLKTQSKYPKTAYISYHCIGDNYAPENEKIELYQTLNELGFDAKLNMIKDEEDVDGKFIKNLKHGMDMSIKTLITKELPVMMTKLLSTPKTLWDNKTITYVSIDRSFKFYEKNNRINLEISKI